jgi:hypothetical protein
MSLPEPFIHLFGPSPAPEPEAGSDPFGRIGAGNPDWETVRGRWMDGAPLRDIFGGNLFRLNAPVGTGRANQRGDVFKLQTLLHREGALDAEATGGPTGYWGNRDDAAMREYQKAGDLTVDGWAAPNGPTMAALRRGYEPPVQVAQAGAKPTVLSDVPPVTPAAQTDAWSDSPIHIDFRRAIHKKESAGTGNDGYAASNRGAYGRYQMRVPALQDAGLIDKGGNWTGKYGLNSFEDFLRQPEAQEKAFADFMARTEGYVRRLAPGYEGRRIQGAMAPFDVTEAGLIAAAHRQGAGMLAPYFEFQKANNWKSGEFGNIPEDVVKKIAELQGNVADPQSAKDVLSSIETRLREFSRIPYRRVAPGS